MSDRYLKHLICKKKISSTESVNRTKHVKGGRVYVWGYDGHAHNPKRTHFQEPFLIYD